MDLPVQQFRTKAEQAYLDLFEAAEKALPGARDPFVSALRTKAIEAYGRLGLPHRRIEAWKYTDLRARLTDVHPLLKAEGMAVGEAGLETALGAKLARLPAYRLVVVEGDLRADLSDIAGLKAKGVEVLSLGRALEKPPAWLKKALGQVNPREDVPVLALNALFQIPLELLSNQNPGTLVDAPRDAQRLLLVMPVQESAQRELAVVLNWRAGLRK
jgi:Fe-S cluster assembly protein SufD